MIRKHLVFTLEESDEVIQFDKSKHCQFRVNLYDIDDYRMIKGDLLQFCMLCFFTEHANWVWNEKKNLPDHDVAMIISNEELAELFGVEQDVMDKAIVDLLNTNYIGIVELENGKVAYHVAM